MMQKREEGGYNMNRIARGDQQLRHVEQAPEDAPLLPTERKENKRVVRKRSQVIVESSMAA